MWCRGIFHSDLKHHLQRDVVWSKSDFANAIQFLITDDAVPFFGTSSSPLAAMLLVDHYHLRRAHTESDGAARLHTKSTYRRVPGAQVIAAAGRRASMQSQRIQASAWNASIRSRPHTTLCVLGLKPPPHGARLPLVQS